jgi:hypothetical protein
MDAVGRLVARRASKVNSWDIATLEERMDYLRTVHGPIVSEKYPASVRDYWFKLRFGLLLGVEPSEEERRAFLEEGREILLTPP